MGNPCPLFQNYQLLSSDGYPGVFVGAIIGVNPLGPGWWGFYVHPDVENPGTIISDCYTKDPMIIVRRSTGIRRPKKNRFFPCRTGKKELQEYQNNQWIEIVSGQTKGSGHSRNFDPVTVQYFRLMITGPEGEVPVLNQLILNRAF